MRIMTITLSIGQPSSFIYTNWQGVTAERTITPVMIWYGSNSYHPDPQWFVDGFCHDRKAMRSFTLKDMRPTN